MGPLGGYLILHVHEGEQILVDSLLGHTKKMIHEPMMCQDQPAVLGKKI